LPLKDPRDWGQDPKDDAVERRSLADVKHHRDIDASSMNNAQDPWDVDLQDDAFTSPGMGRKPDSNNLEPVRRRSSRGDGKDDAAERRSLADRLQDALASTGMEPKPDSNNLEPVRRQSSRGDRKESAARRRSSLADITHHRDIDAGVINNFTDPRDVGLQDPVTRSRYSLADIAHHRDIEAAAAGHMMDPWDVDLEEFADQTLGALPKPNDNNVAQTRQPPAPANRQPRAPANRKDTATIADDERAGNKPQKPL